MAKVKIPKRLAKQVRERARDRCEYCRISEWLSGQACDVDHIMPRAQKGPTESSNLCLACAACNSYKLDQVQALDPETNALVPLFHPRLQHWRDHFTWSAEGTHVIGTTPTGRATVVALKLNRPLVVAARAVWVSIQRHPPSD